jgi:hypothetical protein
MIILVSCNHTNATPVYTDVESTVYALKSIIDLHLTSDNSVDIRGGYGGGTAPNGWSYIINFMINNKIRFVTNILNGVSYTNGSIDIYYK